MKIGASTLYGINSKTVLQCVDELMKAGFEAVEIMHEPGHVLRDKDIAGLKKTGLDFSMHGPFMGAFFTHLNEEFSRPQIRMIQKSLESAARLGCTHYVMHGGNFPKPYTELENPVNRDHFIRLFAERFGEMFAQYSEKGVKIVMENLASGEIGSEIEDIVKLQELIPEMGFCFDIAHAEVLGQTGEVFKNLEADHVHVTDNDLSADQHRVVGEGKIDFGSIFPSLRKKGFRGKVILENSSFGECVRSRDRLADIIGP